MANSDKNILITPSVGLSTNPTIKFNGANNTPTTLRVLDDGTVSFEGTAGQLFSISDGLTGSIFSVNDISGIPSIEVLDTGLVKLNQYGGSTVIGSSAAIQNANSVNAKLSVYSASTSTPNLILKSIASQTANMQEWQNSSGTVKSKITSNGDFVADWSNFATVGLGASTSYIDNTPLRVFSNGASSIASIIRGAASQTADLQQWQNSAGAVVASIDSLGKITSYNRDTVGGNNNLTISGYYNGSTSSLDLQSNGITRVSLISSGTIGTDASFRIHTRINDVLSERFRIATSGRFGFNTNSPSSGLHFLNTTASDIGLIVKGAASQSANLQEWQNSGGTAVASIDPNGTIVTRPVPFAGNQDRAIIGVTDTGNNWAQGSFRFKSDSSGIPRFGFTAPNASNESLTLKGVYIGINTIDPLAQLHITPYGASTKGLIVQGYASQTASLQEWQNSAGTILGRFHPTAGLLIGGVANTSGGGAPYMNFNTTNFTLYSNTSTNIGLIIVGAASQTGNFQEWQNNSGAVLASVSSGGAIQTTSQMYANRYYYSTNGNVTGTSISFIDGSGGGGLSIRNIDLGTPNAAFDNITPLTVAGNINQTADLQRWNNAAGTVLAKIDKDGFFTNTYGANLATGAVSAVAGVSLFVGGQSGAVANTVLKNNSGATYDFIQFRNSSGTTLSSITNNGFLNTPGILENPTISATAATGTINYDLLTNKSVTYYTSNASANWTLNIRGNSSTTLDSLMSAGQSITIVFMVTQGSTAYYQSGFQIDGTSVTPKWQGGIAPTFGNASGIDAYSVTIMKTASATFTVFESQTRFA